MGTGWKAALVASALVALGAGRADAGELRLAVEVVPTCPRAEVIAARLAPLVERSVRLVVVDAQVSLRVFERAGELAGELTAGVRERSLTAPLDQCAALVDALVLAASLGADHRAAAADDTPRGSATAAPATGAAVEARAGPRPVDDRRTALVRAGVGASSGLAPELASGLLIGVATDRGRWSMALEANLAAPSSFRAAGGEVSTQLTTLSWLPCVARGPVSGCGLLTVGLMRSRGRGFERSDAGVTPLVAAGVRLATRVTRVGDWQLTAHVDVAGVLAQTALRVDRMVVWQSAPVQLGAGISAGYHFR